MSSVNTINKISPHNKLLEKLIQEGGIPANRKALKDLQSFFMNEISKPAFEQLREPSWRRN